MVSRIEVLPVLDGTAREPMSVLTPHGNASLTDLAPFRVGEDHLALAVGGYLVRANGQTVLVDAGVGTINNDSYQGGQLLENLSALGVKPEDVHHVVLTHLHFDHVGWVSKKGEPVFANAVVHVHEADWARFVEAEDAQPGAVRKLEPLRPKLATFNEDTEIVPGVVARPFPGHTPGSTVVTCDTNPRTHLIGDVAHWPVELEADWSVKFDEDDQAGRRQRTALAEDLADTGELIGGGHFPELALGRLETVGGRRRWTTTP